MKRHTLHVAVALFVVTLLTWIVSACSSSPQPGAAGTPTTSDPSVTSTTGKMLINPQFDQASPFSEGLAAVRIGDYNTGKLGYISR
jgi:hypothetical protein